MEPVVVRGQDAVCDVERRIRDLVSSLSAGRRPSSDDIVQLQADLGALSRRDGEVPARKLAELEEAVRELVVLASQPQPSASVVVPNQRGLKSATRVAAAPGELKTRFDRLRERVDGLHDEVEAGRRPMSKTFDDVQVDLAAFQRMADGPEIRQMIDDVVAFRRRAVSAARPHARARVSSSRVGRGFWGRPVSRPVRPAPSGQRGAAERTLTPEQARLAEQSRSLRERAELFAAAVPSGRTLPQREAGTLFHDFKLLRPRVDGQTQALNDAAVLRLTEAVVEVRRRASG